MNVRSRLEKLERQNDPNTGFAIVPLLFGETDEDGWRRLHGDAAPPSKGLVVFITRFADPDAPETLPPV